MTCFTHHVLQTRDLVAAHACYRDLLGWTIADGGHCSLQGRDVAAITLSKAPPHVPSYWLPYIGVDDVDAATAKALALGAEARKHVADSEAIIFDPRGAVVGLRADGVPSEACGWDELLTDQADAAARFYAALTGFTVAPFYLGAAGVYYMLRSGTRRVGGVMKHPAALHPHWQTYLAVQDVDAMTERSLQLGATLYFTPRDQPNFGRWSAINDPTGAGVCFLRPA